ncbi:hypothetical protein GCM10007866_18520 [Gluconobacter albidus]|uniref:PARP-type domain-containing protein n=1 Tax=Gluconobacter albidus TaxID=318683 RepID=A0ABQ5X0Q0_9PROT|nr:hypothetical protein [Gluconobacter albidus]GBQ88123.1 hypothetical protein AA3250_1479 [Gluconobacter albidus NBRC 3250]GLQ69401.1 hypothetical protein GCM10007866_18520 [Gluconobacter albidus]
MGFCSEKSVTARKRHQCDACLKIIEPGETYLRVAGVCDDGFWNGAYHADCREWEVKLNHENTDRFPDEWYALHEHIFEGSIDVLDGAPQSVRDRFKPAGGPA